MQACSKDHCPWLSTMSLWLKRVSLNRITLGQDNPSCCCWPTSSNTVTSTNKSAHTLTASADCLSKFHLHTWHSSPDLNIFTHSSTFFSRWRYYNRVGNKSMKKSKNVLILSYMLVNWTFMIRQLLLIQRDMYNIEVAAVRAWKSMFI